MRSRLLLDGRPYDIALAKPRGGYVLHVEDPNRSVPVAILGGPGTRAMMSVAGKTLDVVVALSGDDAFVHLGGRTFHLRYLDPVALHASGADARGADEARAPMPGTVVAVHVAEGDEVAAGAALLTIESMKLETTIRASRAGTVEAVTVAPGQSFDRDAVLARLAGAA